MKVEIHLINTCLWCEEGNLPLDKLLCSEKCMKAINNKFPKDFHYDKDDVYYPRKSK